jgi:hypothetical protein
MFFNAKTTFRFIQKITARKNHEVQSEKIDAQMELGGPPGDHNLRTEESKSVCSIFSYWREVFSSSGGPPNENVSIFSSFSARAGWFSSWLGLLAVRRNAVKP